MTNTTQEGTFLRKGSVTRGYLAYPKFLLDMDLNDTAKLIYILLLDRARIACRRDPTTDKDGNVYILYEVDDLSTRSGKGISTVKEALRTLENAGLIYRGEHIAGRPRRIYVKVLDKSYEPESRPSQSRNSGSIL